MPRGDLFGITGHDGHENSAEEHDDNTYDEEDSVAQALA